MTDANGSAIAFVIPALNEEATIAAVVASVRPFGRAVVVDDGSHDRTGEFARGAGAEVVRHAERGGYDAAVSDGIQHACDTGYTWAVTIDADGQHAASNLPRMVATLVPGIDLVVGVRARRARFSEQVMAWVFDRRWGVHDPLCGMKAYRLDFYRGHRLHGATYASIGTEIMLQYLRAGAQIAQVPIDIQERADAPRFGNRISANGRIFAALCLSLAKNRRKAQ